MNSKTISTIKDAQSFVKKFAKINKWKDSPNIDKFDHMHEELIEMSKNLRYKSAGEMTQYIKENRDVFEDGIGDTLFVLCRLANQLGINMEKSFNLVSGRIVAKYSGKKMEYKLHKKKNA